MMELTLASLETRIARPEHRQAVGTLHRRLASDCTRVWNSWSGALFPDQASGEQAAGKQTDVFENNKLIDR